MRIQGFQKMTLLDFPGKVACTIFTAGCNYRCPFCHNALLVENIDQNEDYKENEILDYLKKRKGILDGVAITGGEPLLYKDTKDFIKKVKELGYSVKLDTNGSFPFLLKEILDEGLVDYVAMDIKNSKEKYLETINIKHDILKEIEESIRLLINSKIDFEFRTTIVKEFHTIEDIEKIANWVKGCKNYYLQNFKDSGNLIGSNMHEVDRDTIYKMKEIANTIIPNVEIRGID